MRPECGAPPVLGTIISNCTLENGPACRAVPGVKVHPLVTNDRLRKVPRLLMRAIQFGAIRDDALNCCQSAPLTEGTKE